MPPIELNWTGVGMFAAGLALNWLSNRFPAPAPAAPPVVAPVVPAPVVPAPVHPNEVQKPLLDLIHKMFDAANSKPIVPAVSTDPKVVAASVAEQAVMNLLSGLAAKMQEQKAS